jgi:hypothetical protein
MCNFKKQALFVLWLFNMIVHLKIRVLLKNLLIDWMNHLIWQKVIYSGLHETGEGNSGIDT